VESEGNAKSEEFQADGHVQPVTGGRESVVVVGHDVWTKEHHREQREMRFGAISAPRLSIKMNIFALSGKNRLCSSLLSTGKEMKEFF